MKEELDQRQFELTDLKSSKFEVKEALELKNLVTI